MLYELLNIYTRINVLSFIYQGIILNNESNVYCSMLNTGNFYNVLLIKGIPHLWKFKPDINIYVTKSGEKQDKIS